jgi:hypothetical protein
VPRRGKTSSTAQESGRRLVYILEFIYDCIESSARLEPGLTCMSVPITTSKEASILGSSAYFDIDIGNLLNFDSGDLDSKKRQ